MLNNFSFHFLRGTRMEGTVLGGNIRCLLKLAGTQYWPDFTGKLLFLECNGGEVPQIVAYLNQLSQLGVFVRYPGFCSERFLEWKAEDCILRWKNYCFG